MSPRLLPRFLLPRRMGLWDLCLLGELLQLLLWQGLGFVPPSLVSILIRFLLRLRLLLLFHHPILVPLEFLLCLEIHPCIRPMWDLPGPSLCLIVIHLLLYHILPPARL